MTSCIYPGSFDPIHKGHLDILERATKSFDKVYIAPISNIHKKNRLNIENRIKLIEICIKNIKYKDKIEIVNFDGMLVEYCVKNNINAIIKGVRNVNDYVAEHEMSSAIRLINNDITTFFLPSSDLYRSISSSIVYEIAKNNGNLKPFLPEEIIDIVKEKIGD